MEEKKAKRKLTAILSADVKGYSHLMQDDEEATVRTITTYREVMTNLIQGHDGRVVDAKGDNILAEFASVVDAVRCAVEIQKELKVRNAELPENRMMEFRIGINLGDVIEEEETIYGDGVNIAARLEGLAEGGGICISRMAFDNVKNKLDVGYEYLGEHSVKNIAEPVRVYKVLMEPEYAGKVMGEEKPKRNQRRWAALASALIIVFGALAIWHFYFRPPPIEPASVEKMAVPLPDKPSIAVLPFTNMSEDPKQEYFSDGLTEEIITALSKTPRVLVIARNSTFSYKGKAVKVNQVAEELGVRYVLEGSVRKAGDRVRITAQLIDALTGHHLWAERYDRDLRDIFDLQDEITIKIISALQVELTDGELASIAAKTTDNLQAYLKFIQSRKPLYTLTKEGIAKARRLCEEAIALDPEYANAYIRIGASHWLDISLGASKSPKESLKRAFEFVKKAQALDDSLPEVHTQLGYLYIMTRQHDKSLAECELAINLAPNSATAHMWMGLALKFAGRFEEAVRYTERALRLDPLAPPWYFRAMGSAYSWVGRHEEAITLIKKTLQRTPNDLLSHVMLTVAYSWAGHLEEARAHADEILRIEPNYSLERAEKSLRYKSKADQERFLDALRKAGLPETPPLPLPDKPSIAVLPFVNMSNDPEQEYFSDGITEEIITALSKTPKLFVIARNSTFTYKGKPVKVQQVGRELGVKYVLEGSVRKSEDKVRITAQLVDASTGHHLWAERYDRELDDIFALQDEITMKILRELELRLTEGEQALLYRRGTSNLEVYLKFLQAVHYVRNTNPEDNVKARKILENVISLAPKYGMAFALLGETYMMDVWFGTTKSPMGSLRKAAEISKKALIFDESLGSPYAILGHISVLERDWEKGISLGHRAIELEPNGANSHYHLGMALNFADRPEEAIPILKKAIRLNPMAANIYLHHIAIAFRMMGQYDNAIEYGEKTVQGSPNYHFGHLNLAACYILAGRTEEARTEAKEVLRINPDFSLEQFAKIVPLKSQKEREKFIGALRKAGLK